MRDMATEIRSDIHGDRIDIVMIECFLREFDRLVAELGRRNAY